MAQILSLPTARHAAAHETALEGCFKNYYVFRTEQEFVGYFRQRSFRSQKDRPELIFYDLAKQDWLDGAEADGNYAFLNDTPRIIISGGKSPLPPGIGQNPNVLFVLDRGEEKNPELLRNLVFAFDQAMRAGGGKVTRSSFQAVMAKRFGKHALDGQSPLKEAGRSGRKKPGLRNG